MKKYPFLSEGRGRITSHPYRDRKSPDQDTNQAQGTTVPSRLHPSGIQGQNLAALESSHLLMGKRSSMCLNVNQTTVHKYPNSVDEQKKKNPKVMLAKYI